MQKNEDPHVWQKLGGSSRPPPSVSRNANIDLLVIFSKFFFYSVSVFFRLIIIAITHIDIINIY